MGGPTDAAKGQVTCTRQASGATPPAPSAIPNLPEPSRTFPNLPEPSRGTPLAKMIGVPLAKMIGVVVAEVAKVAVACPTSLTPGDAKIPKPHILRAPARAPGGIA